MTDRLKKVLMGIAALAALALGASALAGAASNDGASTVQERQDAGDTDGAETQNGARDESEGDDEGDGDHQAVTGTAADRARAAAEAKTGGTAGHIEADTEKGATYEVEVTLPNGDQADVRIDDRFEVIAVDQDQEGDQQQGEHEDAGD
jgi:uncharacterized membrane protein YkoI